MLFMRPLLVILSVLLLFQVLPASICQFLPSEIYSILRQVTVR